MVSDAWLAVYYAQTLVGWLFNTHPLRFEYAPAWREQPDAVSLSPSLPLSQPVHESDSVLAYFENLLPEGDLRHQLELRHHTTTIFGLLNAIGGDTASGFTLLSPNESPVLPHYRPTRWVSMAAHLQQRPQSALFTQHNDEPRISLAGAQNKLLLMVMPDGSPAIPEGPAPSSHILKPDIQGLKGVWATALNETFCTQRLGSVRPRRTTNPTPGPAWCAVMIGSPMLRATCSVCTNSISASWLVRLRQSNTKATAALA